MLFKGEVNCTTDTLVGELSNLNQSLNGNLSNEILRGYSAYEIAVQNGFKGTEEEWLNSLNQKYDYNNLPNRPIINILEGREPIILKDLKEGIYKIRGNYKYDYSSATMTFENPTIVFVKNQKSGEKSIHFENYQNKKYQHIDIQYDLNGDYEENISILNIFTSSLFRNLPLKGDFSKIYITPVGFYVWTGNQYRLIGDNPLWETINTEERK